MASYKVLTALALTCVAFIVISEAAKCVLIKNLRVDSVGSMKASVKWDKDRTCQPADAPLSFELDLRRKDKGVATWKNSSSFDPAGFSYTDLMPNSAYSISVLPHMGKNKMGEPDFYDRSDVVYFNTTK